MRKSKSAGLFVRTCIGVFFSAAASSLVFCARGTNLICVRFIQVFALTRVCSYTTLSSWETWVMLWMRQLWSSCLCKHFRRIHMQANCLGTQHARKKRAFDKPTFSLRLRDMKSEGFRWCLVHYTITIGILNRDIDQTEDIWLNVCVCDVDIKRVRR